jgi:hypothetical protein
MCLLYDDVMNEVFIEIVLMLLSELNDRLRGLGWSVWFLGKLRESHLAHEKKLSWLAHGFWWAENLANYQLFGR